jgi:hypothetical protein
MTDSLPSAMMKFSNKFNNQGGAIKCVKKYNRYGNEKSPVLLRIVQDCRFAFLIGHSELPQNERAFIVQCKIRKKIPN